MTIWFVLTLAALTYLSRVVGLALLPEPSQRVEAILDRVPAPLFAGFASISLVTSSRELVGIETSAALLGALAAVRTRSLLWILAAGLAGYLVGVAIS
ncbi:MAG: AzlD domain-containing protein [Actinomycetota bacterium]|nr:AzlD domain-containing protein [Actinomycetota bacterium]